MVFQFQGEKTIQRDLPVQPIEENKHSKTAVNIMLFDNVKISNNFIYILIILKIQQKWKKSNKI